MAEREFQETFNRELKKILARAIALRFSSGLLSFLAIGAWLAVALAIWTALSSTPPLWQTLTASWVTLGLLALLFIIFVIVPLVKMPGLKRIASEVEHRKDFKDIVVAAYEFSRDSEASKKYHPALVKEVIRQAALSVMPLRARFLFLNRRQMFFVPLAYGGLLAVLVLSLSSPKLIFDSYTRVLEPRLAAAQEHEANIFASPGNVTVLAGSDVEVTGIDFGGTKRPVNIHFSRSNGFWKSEPAEPSALGAEGQALNHYSYTFEGLRSSLSYYFKAGARRSPVYRIAVVNKPMVTSLRITLTPPGYTGEQPETLEDSGGNIQALEGTNVSVEGKSNNVLRIAAVLFDEVRENLLSRAGKRLGEGKAKAVSPSSTRMSGEKREHEVLTTTGKEFNFDFKALRDEFYTILLEDTSGYENDDPLVYSIEVFKDNPPSIDVLEPGGDASLPRNYLLGVSFIAGDDYGVAGASIFYRKGSKGPFHETLIQLEEQQGKQEVAKSFLWDLGGLTLFPGNTIEYNLQVEDNNVVTGPGMAKSRIFQVVVPTMAELYENIAEEGARRSNLLEQSLDEGEEFKRRIEKLSREFAKTEHFDWSQKKEIDKAIEGQERIKEKLEEVQSSLDRTLQELSDNRMTSMEIGKKLEEIGELLEEINSEALKQYVEDLQKAVASLSPQEIKDSLRNLNLSAEDLLKKLERTAELLKAVRKEQEMEELVRKSRELMEKQKDLLDATAEASSSNKAKMTELSRKQKELAEEAAAMKKAMEEFAKKLDASEREIAKRLESSAQRLSQNAVAEKMSRASGKLKSGEKNQAMDDQEEALEDLISLFTSMSQCRANMGQMAMNRNAAHLQKYARESLNISFKQEELLESLREAASLKAGSSTSRALAEKQLSYFKATEKVTNQVFEISKQTMAVSAVLLQTLGEALSEMQKSIFNLEQNRRFYSVPNASRALALLNQATIEMLRAAKSCSSGSGSGMGARDLLEQLLSGEQDILQQSKEMLSMQMLQEKLRMEKQARMRRIAAAQRSLKEVAEEIEKQLKEDKSSLGRMDQIIEDMEAVIKDLEGGTLDERTLEHEERILSRLLDAQRSIHSRDYERKRESLTARDIFSRGAAATVKKDAVSKLREEIKRAMKLKAPGEFEDLIKYYFRALAEEYSRLEESAQ